MTTPLPSSKNRDVLYAMGSWEALAVLGGSSGSTVTGNTKRDHSDTPTGVLSEIERRKDLQARKISGDA